MDTLATKTRPEREDEETERLVRPPSKVKPPRHDRRRERVHVDEDPDKESDPDESKNYKDIGGAVLLRWAKEKGKNVPVLNKETGKPVPGGVSVKTLKKHPEKYKLLKKVPKSKKDKKPKQKWVKPEAAPEVSDSGMDETFAALDELAKSPEIAKKFQYVLRDTGTGGMGLGETVKANPNTPLKAHFPGVQFPSSIKNMGDLQKALKEQVAAKKEAPEPQPKEPAPAEAEEPAPAESPKPAKKKKAPKDNGKGPKKAPRSDEDISAEVARKWVEDRKHKRPDFRRFLDEMPTGDVDPATGDVLVLNPDTRKRVPFEELPPDYQAALVEAFTARRQSENDNKATVSETLKAGKSAVGYLSTDVDAEVREALETLGDPNSEASKKAAKLVADGYDLKEVRPEKLFPNLKGKIPRDLNSVDLAQKIVKSALDYRSLPVAERTGVGEPWRRPVSEAEQGQTLSYLLDNLPPEEATRVFEMGIHPDDAETLVSAYKEAKKEPVKDPVKFAQQVSEVYTDNPSTVEPPKKWNGKLFQHLTNEEKAEALRQRQMEVMAVSMAAKDKLAETLSRGTGGFLGGGGIPPVLASTLAGAMLLQKPSSSEKVKAEQTEKMAQIAFDTMMSEGHSFDISDKAIKTVLGRLDPHTQKVAQAFFQANDYQAAKDKYLKGGEYEGLSEYGTPRSILKGIRKASEYLDTRSAIYGGGNVAKQLFRTRVMDKLRVLAPDKYATVRARLDQDETQEYNEAYKDWERAHKEWLKRKNAVEKKPPEGEPYREPAEEFDEPEPEEPIKPLRYGKKPKKKGDLWSSVFGETKTASRVAGRYRDLISTYPGVKAMGPNYDKRAVYHGVEPDRVAPYPKWQQAHQRDLGEPDFQTILASARKWLQTPVLSKHVEGLIPDQQFRAALDYSIQTGIYNRAVNPTLYNMLLARLAGWPEPGPEQTLMTIRGSTCENPNSRRAEMTAKTAEQSKYASEICGRIDKLALDIQQNHSKWGMSMEDAKAVVNAIDQAADNFEKAAFGTESFENRQREVLAAVIQRDPDEPYMDNFNNIHQPEQTDADEPYMSAYNDDQSSAVETGKEENGERIAP